MLPIGIVEAYNNTLKLVFKVWSWMSDRPKQKLENKRKELEELSRVAQIKGDVHEMRRIRAQIEEVDRDLQSLIS